MAKFSTPKQGPKNGSIHRFFIPIEKREEHLKPGPESEPEPEPETAPEPELEPKVASPRALLAPITPQRPGSKSSLPFSSPAPLKPSPSPSRKPPAAPASRAPLSRDTVIVDSDEDGDDSDSSLEDIGSWINHRYPSAAVPASFSQPDKKDLCNNPCVTPRAKRTAGASAFQLSPLTPKLPKPEFDMSTLLKDALKTDHIISGFRKPATKLGDDSIHNDGSGLSNTIAAIDLIRGITGDEKADKARKALERTGTGPLRKRWYFFGAHEPATAPLGRPPFPNKAATGPWSILRNNAKREQTLVSGLPQMFITNGHQLPDELFMWILDAVTREGVASVRQDWIALLMHSPDQVQRLITPKVMDGMLTELGATEDISIDSARLHLVPEQETRYRNRDWGRLTSWLQFVSALSFDLDQDVIERCLHHLLRMAVDPIVTTNLVHIAHGEAVGMLCEAVHRGRWDKTCYDLCNSIHVAFAQPSLRVATILTLPSTSSRLHDLKRRLAVSFLFDDASLAERHPDDTLSLRAVRDRLDGDEFVVRKGTDYVEMRALVLLLNLAVDDGPLAPKDDVDDADTVFNADIDSIAGKLKAIWRNIIDTGGAYTSRTDAKNVLEWVEQRLVYAVRTRRQPKHDIFDLAARWGRSEDDGSLPKQQMYMQRFLGKTQ